MLTKTNELTDAPLDWAVAKCLTLTGAARGVELRDGVPMVLDGCWAVAEFSYNWDQGGPIIEREGILLRPLRRPGHSLDGQWLAMYDGTNTGTMVQWVKRTDWVRHYHQGPTPLIAAMRCYVASKMGDEIEIPEELAK